MFLSLSIYIYVCIYSSLSVWSRKRRLIKPPAERRTRLEGKLRSDCEVDTLDGAVCQPSKLCPSDPTYLDSQSYVTNRWQPTVFLAPFTSTGRPVATEYGTGAPCAVRYSEHLYESPNFERKDVPLLSASLSRYDAEVGGKHCERDGACAAQGRRSLTDPGCVGN